MAALKEDLDAILAIDGDTLQSNEGFEVDLAAVVNEIPEEDAKVTFSCSFCTTVCVSRRGLTRHTNAKLQSKEKDKSVESGSEKSTTNVKEAATSFVFQKIHGGSCCKASW